MMKNSSSVFQEHSLSAKTPANVATTPNLLPLKISPDDEHTRLEKSAMPYMPSLYSPEEDDEEKYTPFLATATDDYEGVSLALPAMLPDPFSLDDHVSFSPLSQRQPKKRSHGPFVLRPRQVDRTGMETPYQEVGADNLPRKRPRMPLFVSLDDDAHNDDHRQYKQGTELVGSAFSSPRSSNSSITPVTDSLHPSLSGGSFDGPEVGEKVIALPRVFRPTIRRVPTSPSKNQGTQGPPKVFVPSSTSAFSVSQCVHMVVTPPSKITSPSLSW